MTTLAVSKQALEDLAGLEANPASAKRLRKVKRVLGLMQVDLRHPSLNTHKLTSIFAKTKSGDDVPMWEAYVENNTSGAWRIFYYFDTGQIIVASIRQHP